MVLSPEESLHEIKQLHESQEFCILKLSEPISATVFSLTKRDSDVSSDAFENTTPASLESDLTHYRELFAKLHFSYLEQVTKEKFLRAIVAEPPEIYTPAENIELEQQLFCTKQELKAHKEDLRLLVEELERKGKALAKQYEGVQLHTAKLESLPNEIIDLEKQIVALKQMQHLKSATKPGQDLPLPATLSLLRTKENSLAQLEKHIVQLKAAVPRKSREVERLDNELRPLELQKVNAVNAANETRKRKEQGGGEDGLLERGRWWRTSETVLATVLGFEK
ncbi:MAG: hypothetical protein M1834_003430 [Cirrosporium novae-zelandiae]|nr:MAG: hypothetical protein M1834_003430 [Cirrosporium novae-zelandiae]